MSDKIDRSGKVGRPSLQLMEERDNEILRLVLDCKPKSVIYQDMFDKYNIGKKAVDHLLTKAYTTVRENYAVDRETILFQHIQKYYAILNSIEDFDPRAKILALQAIEKLMKLHNPDVAVQNNSISLNLKDLSVNDLKELLKDN